MKPIGKDARPLRMFKAALFACVGVAAGFALGPTHSLAQSQPRVEPAEPPKPEGDSKPHNDQDPGAQPDADNDAPPDSESDAAPEALEPADMPDLEDSVLTLMGAEYLTDAERADLRVRHGVWEESDLTSPALRCAAALDRGAFTDASFAAPDAPPLARAESLLMLGKPADAITALTDDTSMRAARLRAEALVQLGKRNDAESVLLALVPRVREASQTDADETAEGVRAMLLLARLRGAEDPKVMGYEELLSITAHARDSLDRLNPNVALAEAMLLYEKGMLGECAEALESCLTLNPRCAEGWHLLGRLNAMTFSFEDADRIALRLDLLAGTSPTGDGEPGVSTWAALVRAHAKIRQNEGALAIAALEPALTAFPGNRELLAMQAAAAAVSFDFDRTDQLLAAYDTLSPNAPEAFIEAGKALADARQYDDAAKYLRTASERAPTWAEPLVELGLSELQAGRLTEAGAALDKALLLDRYHLRAKNSQTLLRELATYESVEGEHFIVRFKPGPDQALATEMLPVLERIYTRVTGNGPGGINHQPPGKTVVELYPNQRWFAVRIVGMPSLHTFAAATGPVIAMEAPRAGPGHLVGPYDWARVVQHEYTHTVTLSLTKNRLPHWFTEAGAVYLEDSPRDWNTVQLLTRAIETDCLFDFDTINVMFTRPRKPSDRAQAYAQGAWMYEYIIKQWGQEAPLKLMTLYATGVREPEAFQRVLSVSREQFLSDFQQWAHAQLIGWGMVAKEGQQTIAELLDHVEDAEPTPELIATWRETQPDNPFVLALAARQVTKKPRPEWTPDDIATLNAYAAARSVDPLPHRELAAYYLTNLGAAAGQGPSAAIPHLEYLDAREQNSPAFAIELARQYAAQANWPLALKKARRATQIAPYDGTIRESAATIALQAGDLAEAEEQVWALTLIEPDREVHKQRLAAIRKRRQ